MTNSNTSLPSYGEIIKSETISSSRGSSITREKLIGIWRFQKVWKKGSHDVDNISSSFLQVLSASLEFSEISSKKENEDIFEIKNSISFGLISITFAGEAFLKGKRPLLIFSFKNLFLKIGNINLLNKKFEDIEEKKMPFFSLISICENNKWICARGKGGGIAIWEKN